MTSFQEEKIDSILTFWFGEGDWNAGLWFQGFNANLGTSTAQAANKQEREDAKSRTDKYIKDSYGHLIDLFVTDDKSELKDIVYSSAWMSTSRGKVALMLLLDQYSRNAFRGTRKMFAYDTVALSIAQDLVNGDQFHKLPWNHKLFAFICLTHAENEVVVNKAGLGLSSLVLELENSGNGPLAKKIRRILKSTEDHLSILQKFGRYPHRNAVLERVSTQSELEYLRGKLPTWAESVVPAGNQLENQPIRDSTPVPSPITGSKILSILVLHSNRQNASSFAKATVSVLESDEYDLTYMPAPHAYVPKGAAAAAVSGMSAADKAATSDGNLCWWNATDDPDTMIYEGLEESLKCVDDMCRERGPFHGLLGFSQGGSLAGIVARLQLQQHPLVSHCRFEFFISISGFACRDVRPEFNMSHGCEHEGGLLAVPSYHIWGEADTLVENNRSRAMSEWFIDPVVKTHGGGHFRGSVSQWPVEDMKAWIRSLSLSVELGPSATSSVRLNDHVDIKEDVPPQASLDAKLEATRQKNRFLLEPSRTAYVSARWGKSRNNRKQLRVLQPYGLCHPTIISHDVWQQVVESAPFYDTKGFRREDMNAFVRHCMSGMHRNMLVQSEEESFGLMISDLFLLAFCVFPYEAFSPPHQSNKDRHKRLDEQGEVFFWLFEAIMRANYCLDGPMSTKNAGLRSALDHLVEVGGWNDLTRLDLLVCTGTSVRIIISDKPLGATQREMDDAKLQIPHRKNMSLDSFEQDVHGAIVDLISTRLHMDYRALEQLRSTGPPCGELDMGYDELVTKKLNIAMESVRDGNSVNSEEESATVSVPVPTAISNCVNFAPRLKSYTEKTTGLASAVGRKLLILKLQDSITAYDGGAAIDHNQFGGVEKKSADNTDLSPLEKLTIRGSILYRALLRDLTKHLKMHNEKVSNDSLARYKTAQIKEWRERIKAAESRNSKMYSSSSEEAYQLLVQQPLSYGVLNPEPEPVDIATREEMAQLHRFFQSQNIPGASGIDASDRDIIFEKGTLCTDKRLDLCKQVVGPTGVESLMSSLALDFTGKHQVEHLLLGNNICGDSLGFAMASLIAEGKSGLTTWYIAGNRLTEKGMRPICEVLSKDSQVQQLWLKRNPLKAEGATLVADMLRLNSTIVVLDLVNTAMLDAGAAVLFNALGFFDSSTDQSFHNSTRNSTLQHLYLDGNGLTVVSAELIGAYLGSGINRLHTLSIGGNRLGNAGTLLVAQGMQADVHVQRLGLASVGMGAAGGEAIAAMIAVNTTLLHVDLGLMKFTSALGEIPNRIGVAGAVALANVLRAHNRTLRSLVLLNNNIHQTGIAAFRSALLGDESLPADTAMSKLYNSTIVRLELEQLGVPFNELTREEIRLAIRRNYLALDNDQKEKADEAVNPSHLKSILSVYRVNGSYTN